jgi:hypothetical protein
MTIDIPTTLEAAAGLITAIGGVYPAISHYKAKVKKNKELYRKEILDQAKTEMEKIEKDLKDKIKFLESEFQAQKISIYKDFNFFKETHNSEIKALGEKIENLRADLSQQHANLVALLTKLVDSR